jgi:hypothetical protein
MTCGRHGIWAEARVSEANVKRANASGRNQNFHFSVPSVSSVVK